MSALVKITWDCFEWQHLHEVLIKILYTGAAAVGLVMAFRLVLCNRWIKYTRNKRAARKREKRCRWNILIANMRFPPSFPKSRQPFSSPSCEDYNQLVQSQMPQMIPCPSSLDWSSKSAAQIAQIREREREIPCFAIW